MPTNYRKKTQPEAQPILTGRKSSSLGDLAEEQLQAVMAIAAAAVTHNNAIYITPGRFGSVTFKLYIEGEQFAETFNPSDDWPDLAEQVIEALYDRETVAQYRRFFAARRDERPSAARETGKPTSG